LLGDANRVSPKLADRLPALATSEANLEVRSQLASTARRLPAEQGLSIVRQLAAHEEDLDDPRQPLLLWWAIESKADGDRDRVVEFFKDSPVWDLPIVKKHLLHRVMRRYAQSGTRKDLLTCAALLKLSPDEERSQQLMRGFEEAYQGRAVAGLPKELVEAMAKVGGKSIALGLRQGEEAAIDKALAVIADAKADNNERLQYIQIFGEVRDPRAVPVLLDIVKAAGDDGLRMTALTSLQPYNDPHIPPAVLALYGNLNDDARSVAQTLLVSRKAWALALAAAVDAGQIDAKTIPVDVARQLTVHRDETLAALVAKHWGSIAGATTAEMQAQIARLSEVVRTGGGSPYPGKKLFTATCAKCHKLHGQGGQIGPDLTAYKRDDLANMLVNIVNPSAEIREGFETYQVVTTDGRTLVGFLVDRDNQVIVLRGADGQNITIAQDQIDEMARDRKSLMPENQLKELSEQQVRDLMAYLRSSQPLND
jgi:putative heme-binding domain-containing protein